MAAVVAIPAAAEANRLKAEAKNRRPNKWEPKWGSHFIYNLRTLIGELPMSA